jgi:hypothetical protein
MAERNKFRRGLCVTIALFILIAVSNSPLLPRQSRSASFCQTCSGRDLGTCPAQAVRLSLKSAAINAATISDDDAIEDDEEDRFVSLNSPTVLFVRLIPSPSPKWDSGLLITKAVWPSSQVLRC